MVTGKHDIFWGGTAMRPLDGYIREQLTSHLVKIGDTLGADVVTIVSPILPGLELRLREAIEALDDDRKDSLAIILGTEGGIVEVVERMVTALRHVYGDVTVIVPDRAMSAGTILALSADRIMMDHLSSLGPIDPQVERDGKLVPALSYLIQYERLNNKAETEALTTAEYALLSKLDLGELYQFEQARELSVELLVKWLSRYKFKNWNKTEIRQLEVTPKLKKERAQNVADLLNDPERWHSHGRAIDMRTLQEEVSLKIDNLADNEVLHKDVRDYFELLKDYMHREQIMSFVQTRGYF